MSFGEFDGSERLEIQRRVALVSSVLRCTSKYLYGFVPFDNGIHGGPSSHLHRSQESASEAFAEKLLSINCIDLEMIIRAIEIWRSAGCPGLLDAYADGGSAFETGLSIARLHGVMVTFDVAWLSTLVNR